MLDVTCGPEGMVECGGGPPELGPGGGEESAGWGAPGAGTVVRQRRVCVLQGRENNHG